MIIDTEKTTKPFIKWAGGKTQLLPQFELKFPDELKLGTIKNYYEPFLGGGAVYFHIAQKYNIENSILFDINEELILVYKVIKEDPSTLIEFIDNYKKKYHLLNEKDQEDFFYEIRNSYNSNRFNINHKKFSENWIPRAAQMIFLNKTCFNGLFRLNSKGEFNVPFGRYKNPQFYENDNILKISKLLQHTELFVSDFSDLENFVSNNSFIYFDPPYRPISKTASFTSYSKNDFNDEDQIRLSKIFKNLDKKDVKLMLSNSDPKNVNPNDNFFETHYKNYNIQRVSASRMINCNGEKRGKINELIITNY
jgi:DNA adenine methylase